MLIECDITTMDKVNRHSAYRVTIQLFEVSPGANDRLHWVAVQTATNRVVDRGVMVAPRANHPDFVGRVTAMVLARAFPLVPENRYMNPYGTEKENAEHGK